MFNKKIKTNIFDLNKYIGYYINIYIINYENMIFDFLKKQKELNKQRKIIELMIISLNIPEEQKELYLGAISILESEGLEKLYKNLSRFINELELENIDEIEKSNFYHIAGMRKKEAKEKQKELNSFSFLISNL